MTRRLVAGLMLVAGLGALVPLLNIVAELLRSGARDSENVMFVLICMVPAIGSALIVGAIWLYTSSGKVVH